ncbi:MAG: hypothetical protein IPK82_20965 [Polyangiaceae bacterium]|nr:hypothetical protein [Polyangiaceae bacterium]
MTLPAESLPIAGNILVRDELELEVIVQSLAERRRMVAFLLCPPPFLPAVVAHLQSESGVHIPQPILGSTPGAVVTPVELLAFLTEASLAPTGQVRCIQLQVAAPTSIKALNFNREKLRRGASVLLFLPDEETLRLVRRLAPDAFSFRDELRVVEGDLSPPAHEGNLNAEEIQELQDEWEMADGPIARGNAAIALADVLSIHGDDEGAAEILEDALSEILPMGSSARVTAVRSKIYRRLAAIHCREGQYLGAAENLVDAARVDDASVTIYRHVDLGELGAWSTTPLGADHTKVAEALQSAEVADTSNLKHALFFSTQSSIQRGDLSKAQTYLQQLFQLPTLSTVDRLALRLEQVRLAMRQGRFAEAERLLDKHIGALEMEGLPNSTWLLEWAHCAALRGELSQAQRLYKRISDAVSNPSYLSRIGAVDGHARLYLLADEPAKAVLLLSDPLPPGIRPITTEDGAAYVIAQSWVDLVAQFPRYSAPKLERAVEQAIERLAMLHTLDKHSAERREAYTDAPTDPPGGEWAQTYWYHLLPSLLRGKLALATGNSTDAAIQNLQQALIDAARVWPDVVPKLALVLGELLLKSRRAGELTKALQPGRAYAHEHSFVEEEAGLQSLQLRAIALGFFPKDTWGKEYTSFRETLKRTNGQRITAEKLLDLALHLPNNVPMCTPEPLLKEALELFTEMGMPHERARCFEGLGDFYDAAAASSHALSNLSAAVHHYKEALQIRKTYGMFLHVRELEKKLEKLTRVPRSNH